MARLANILEALRLRVSSLHMEIRSDGPDFLQGNI
jgi:hypothetical protein